MCGLSFALAVAFAQISNGKLRLNEKDLLCAKFCSQVLWIRVMHKTFLASLK